MLTGICDQRVYVAPKKYSHIQLTCEQNNRFEVPIGLRDPEIMLLLYELVHLVYYLE